MNKFLLVILSGLIFSSSQAASFDCAKAGTNIEKLICSTSELSSLDEELGDSYRAILDIYGGEERSKTVSEQRRWLKHIRNKCGTDNCLVKVYVARIKEINNLNPFADNNISCEEMEKNSKLIFQAGIDLGSGHGSPNRVDYDCQQSLASLPFVSKLLGLAETIRGVNGPQICTGSIVHAQWRYYYFDLARAGYSPKHVKPGYKNNIETYFEQWSWESPYNNELYRAFYSEFATALPLLQEHYRKRFNYSKQESKELARNSLKIILRRAAGSFPDSLLKKTTRLVELARNEVSTETELKNELSALPQKQASIDQAYYALKIALYNNKPENFITRLMKYIGRSDAKQLTPGNESALFAALDNQQYVELLLNNGEPVDYTNSFGKTPLYYAIQLNKHELVTTLLHRGADVNHTYKSVKELNPNNWSCEADTYIKHTKRTPLMHAAQHSDIEMIKLLLKSGARLNDIDEIGFTAYDYSVMGNKQENTVYLKSVGAKLGKSV